MKQVGQVGNPLSLGLISGRKRKPHNRQVSLGLGASAGARLGQLKSCSASPPGLLNSASRFPRVSPLVRFAS